MAVTLRLVAIGSLCLASLSRTRLAPRGRPLAKPLLLATGAVAVVVILAAVAADTWLREAIDPTTPPSGGGQAGSGAHLVVATVQLMAMGLYVCAAAGFS